ncbi:MAG: DUF2721 domain-containing protein [Chloroflexota bacterium]|nr:DUF2721 domain-containing protein [Chloroflexota bacterium]
MTIEAITAVIQLIIAPVVMVSACSIFVNGLLTRYGALNDRMRLMAQERLHLCHDETGERRTSVTLLIENRLALIDYQLPMLLHRHAHLRDSIFLLYLAILIYVLVMFIIAAATSILWLQGTILLVFLGGTACLFLSALLALLEIRTSNKMIRYEVEQVKVIQPTVARNQ